MKSFAIMVNGVAGGISCFCIGVLKLLRMLQWFALVYIAYHLARQVLFLFMMQEKSTNKRLVWHCVSVDVYVGKTLHCTYSQFIRKRLLSVLLGSL